MIFIAMLSACRLFVGWVVVKRRFPWSSFVCWFVFCLLCVCVSFRFLCVHGCGDFLLREARKVVLSPCRHPLLSCPCAPYPYLLLPTNQIWLMQICTKGFCVGVWAGRSLPLSLSTPVQQYLNTSQGSLSFLCLRHRRSPNVTDFVSVWCDAGIC